MSDLLQELKRYARALSEAAKWHATEEALSHIDAQTGKPNGADYIYEFFCYMVVMSDLKTNYKLEYKSGLGKHSNKFPLAPAMKKYRPYFVVKDQATDIEVFQVCAGTKIGTPFSTCDRCPDISFQKPGTSTTPTCKDVFMAFDAKHNRTTSDKEKVGSGQYSEFAMMLRELELDTATPIPVIFDKLKKMSGNCIITNSEAYSKDPLRNQKHSLKEVEYFDEKLDFSKINVIG